MGRTISCAKKSKKLRDARQATEGRGDMLAKLRPRKPASHHGERKFFYRIYLPVLLVDDLLLHELLAELLLGRLVGVVFFFQRGVLGFVFVCGT